MKNRLVLPLYDHVLESLNFDLDKPDEIFICRLHPPYLTVRVAIPERVFPLNAFSLSDLPPAWPQRRKDGAR